MPRSSRHSRLAPPLPEGTCSARSRACPLGHPAPSRTPSASLSPEGSRGLQCPDARHRLDPALRSCELEQSPCEGCLLRGSLLSYDPVFRFLTRLGAQVRAIRSRPRSPSSMSFDGGARQARSPSPHGGPDAPLARLTSRASFAMGTANAGDPGRHRPMSATHDSVFKTGTLRPGTLHSVFPHLAVARASRRSSQPRRSRLHHEGVLFPRSVSARTEHASSPAGSPAERDSSRPPASPAALPRRSVFEHGAAPRWSRPASPGRVNDLGSVDGPKHLRLLSHVSPPR